MGGGFFCWRESPAFACGQKSAILKDKKQRLLRGPAASAVHRRVRAARFHNCNAEPSEAVRIQYRRMEEAVLLTLTNTVSSGRESRESTNIGLNTCRRIMKMLGGSFETEEAGGVFNAEVRLPFSDNNFEETIK